MVFQRPNPLPLSIRDNVLFSHRIHRGRKRVTRARRRRSWRRRSREVLLWDAVKDRLSRQATDLSLEEQQKLCIARLLPVKPTVILMDEPCSALDPAGTEAVEDLMWELRGDYTILIVTHNMAQARRASEETDLHAPGQVVEHASPMSSSSPRSARRRRTTSRAGTVDLGGPNAGGRTTPDRLAGVSSRHHFLLMTKSTWITMLGILTYVWGGFLLALKTAIRKEADKAGE